MDHYAISRGGGRGRRLTHRSHRAPFILQRNNPSFCSVLTLIRCNVHRKRGGSFLPVPARVTRPLKRISLAGSASSPHPPSSRQTDSLTPYHTTNSHTYYIVELLDSLINGCHIPGWGIRGADVAQARRARCRKADTSPRAQLASRHNKFSLRCLSPLVKFHMQ